jgi:hypothetical protein
MPQSDMDDLLPCLSETRGALLSGNIKKLVTLTERTERALEQGKRLAEQDLIMLRAAAEENRRLLDAALKGIRAAKRRASDLTEVGRFSTYEEGGKRNQPGLPSLHQLIRF